MDYKKEIDEYIKNNEYEKLINQIFFLKPTLNVTEDILYTIIQETSNFLRIPFRDIKIIGSAHTGFSFVKYKESKEIKFFDPKNSDIDIAIINKDLFYYLMTSTLEKTDNYVNNHFFDSPKKPEYYKNNLLKGFIRPDTIGDPIFRKEWLDFFLELGNEFKIKISGAIYLNEITFHKKIDISIAEYKKKLEE